jgi:hypothetical protein
MKCLKPIEFMGKTNIPCRQCMNCRINAQRVWACRIQLEGFFHAYSTFVTLTYADPDEKDFNSDLKFVVGPDGVMRDTLSIDHLRNFIRRFKYAIPPEYESKTLRWFGVGEYGSKTQRSHYHVMLFGVDPLAAEEACEKAWKKDGKPIGHFMCSEINAARSAYIAQYTTKKMVTEDHPDYRFKLNGRTPEFMRSSRNRPGGIGIPAVPWLAHTMGRPAALRKLADYGDVWNSVRIEGRIWPLGDYLRKKIRDHMGIPQNAQDRAILFEHFDRETGELYSPPLPNDYCPDEDISEVITAYARKHGKKAFIKDELPQLEKRAAKLKRRTTKTKQTVNV